MLLGEDRSVRDFCVHSEIPAAMFDFPNEPEKSRFVWCNQAFRELMGHPSEKLFGEPWKNWIVAPDAQDTTAQESERKRAVHALRALVETQPLTARRHSSSAAASPGTIHDFVNTFQTAGGKRTVAWYTQTLPGGRFGFSRVIDLTRYGRAHTLRDKFLPPATAEQLEKNPHGIIFHESAPVIFITIKNLPEDSLRAANVMHQFYSECMSVANEYGVWTVKVMSYGSLLLVGGILPGTEKFAVQDSYAFSQRILQLVAEKGRFQTGGEPLDIRVGLHVGPVTTGVLAQDRPAFDVLGATVNYTARLLGVGFPLVISRKTLTLLMEGRIVPTAEIKERHAILKGFGDQVVCSVPFCEADIWRPKGGSRLTSSVIDAARSSGTLMGILPERELSLQRRPGEPAEYFDRPPILDEVEKASLSQFTFSNALLPCCVSTVVLSEGAGKVIGGKFSQVNSAFAELLGYTGRELIGKSWVELLALPGEEEGSTRLREERARALAALEGILKDKEKIVSAFSNHYRRKDGSLVRIEWHTTVNPETREFFSIAFDVTHLDKLYSHAFRFVPRLVIEDIARSHDMRASKEHKVVVLFFDIKDFTQTTASVDSRTVFEVLARFYGESVSRLVGRGFWPVQLQGDAMLVVWGSEFSPESGELDLQEMAKRLLELGKEMISAASRCSFGERPIQIRVGCSVGVVRGNIILPGRPEWLVSGTAVSEAMGLEGAATPGSVRMTRAFHDLTRGRYEDCFECKPGEAPVLVPPKGTVAAAPGRASVAQGGIFGEGARVLLSTDDPEYQACLAKIRASADAFFAEPRVVEAVARRGASARGRGESDRARALAPAAPTADSRGRGHSSSSGARARASMRP